MKRFVLKLNWIVKAELSNKLEVSHQYGYADVFEISFEKVRDIEKMRETLCSTELETRIEEILEVEAGSWKRNVYLD